VLTNSKWIPTIQIEIELEVRSELFSGFDGSTIRGGLVVGWKGDQRKPVATVNCRVELAGGVVAVCRGNQAFILTGKKGESMGEFIQRRVNGLG
jgi:hypothetical protein